MGQFILPPWTNPSKSFLLIVQTCQNSFRRIHFRSVTLFILKTVTVRKKFRRMWKPCFCPICHFKNQFCPVTASTFEITQYLTLWVAKEGYLNWSTLMFIILKCFLIWQSVLKRPKEDFSHWSQLPAVMVVSRVFNHFSFSKMQFREFWKYVLIRNGGDPFCIGEIKRLHYFASLTLSAFSAFF